eukprot:m.70960 g.70960  ORF g.70960 m.70960 type:complete len:382 (+) comp10044_c0_seq1:617-1762(+)
MWGWRFDTDVRSCDTCKMSNRGAGCSGATGIETSAAAPAAAVLASPPRLTYHINTVSFIRQELQQLGWSAGSPGQRAVFAMWHEQRGSSLAGGASARARSQRSDRRANWSLYPRDDLDRIDDKVQLALHLRAIAATDCETAVPEGPITYLSVAELDADPLDNKIFFLKLSAVDAALGVWCLESKRAVAEAVADRGLQPGTYVIQREIPSPRLIDSRKCSVRSYVVVWGHELWLWSEFLLKIHAAPYTDASTSKEVHVGCRAANQDVEARRGTELATHAADVAEMRRVVAATLGPWADGLAPPPSGVSGQYGLLGVDFLFDCDDVGHLIEVNCSPCLRDTGAFTNAVKRELAEDFCRLFVAPTAVGLDPAPMTAFVQCRLPT